MAYARGPIKYTCPDIDRQKTWNETEIKALDAVLRAPENCKIKELVSALEDARTRLDECNDFLEEMRGSNDTLRTWGAEMEDLAEERAKEIEDLNNQLSKLETY